MSSVLVSTLAKKSTFSLARYWVWPFLENRPLIPDASSHTKGEMAVAWRLTVKVREDPLTCFTLATCNEVNEKYVEKRIFYAKDCLMFSQCGTKINLENRK